MINFSPRVFFFLLCFLCAKVNWTLTADFFTSLQSLPVWVGVVRSLLFFYSRSTVRNAVCSVFFVCNFFLFLVCRKTMMSTRRIRSQSPARLGITKTRSIKLDDRRYFNSKGCHEPHWTHTLCVIRSLIQICLIHFSSVHSPAHSQCAFRPNYRSFSWFPFNRNSLIPFSNGNSFCYFWTETDLIFYFSSCFILFGVQQRSVVEPFF